MESTTGKIKVAQYGLGPIGLETVRVVLRKERLELVAALDIDTEMVGKDVGEFLGGGAVGVKVRGDVEDALMEARPQVVLHTTQSFLDKVSEQLMACVKAGAHVVSSTEELTFPAHRQAELTRQLNEAAREAGVVIFGTGVNPGFVMDALPIALTGVCTEVRSIRAERVVDASKRRLPLQRKVGAGLSEDEFYDLVSQGKLGHIGLVESMAVIRDALGWEVDFIEETIDPMIADRDYDVAIGLVKEGSVAGIKHIVKASYKDYLLIDLDLRMYIGAEEPRDAVVIVGHPPVRAVIPGGVFGDTATVAALVNAIPRVLSAGAGVKTIKEMPIPRAFL